MAQFLTVCFDDFLPNLWAPQAAVTIQRHLRGFLVRIAIRRHRAAVVIQVGVRHVCKNGDTKSEDDDIRERHTGDA